MGNIQVVLGDITAEHVDVVVNAANQSLCGGGGVDGAIHRAAGPGLLEECRKLGGCPTWQARLTEGHKLAAKYIAHTPGPVWYGGESGEAELLASCYRSCLHLAAGVQAQSVAFPSISTGAYRFPIRDAARIAVETIKSELEALPSIQIVKIVCFSEPDRRQYQRALDICGRSGPSREHLSTTDKGDAA